MIFNPKDLNMIYQFSTRVFSIYMVAILFILASCDSSVKESEEKSLEDSIAEYEAELFKPNQTKLDKRKALDLVNLYVEYADQNPEDPESPEYLFKASDISMNLNRPQKTIELFDRILVSYPTYSKTPSALFLKAFVYEDQLQDYDAAREYYTLFMETYPDSEFADDAEISLKNLGKSPEELIREFEESNN